MTKKSVKLIIRDICTRFWFAAAAAVAMPAVSLSAGTFVVTLLNLAAVADEDDGGTTAAPAAAPE
jgi:hypothetical protein